MCVDKVSAHQAVFKLLNATALFDHESMYSDGRTLGVFCRGSRGSWPGS